MMIRDRGGNIEAFPSGAPKPPGKIHVFPIHEKVAVEKLILKQHALKRQRENPKFYYFDLGVKRALDGTLSSALVKNTYAYGKAFEHMVICEIFRMNSYLEKDYRLSYLRTKDGAEVDLFLVKMDSRNCHCTPYHSKLFSKDDLS